jgi:hypothetical protein
MFRAELERPSGPSRWGGLLVDRTLLAVTDRLRLRESWAARYDRVVTASYASGSPPGGPRRPDATSGTPSARSRSDVLTIDLDAGALTGVVSGVRSVDVVVRAAGNEVARLDAIVDRHGWDADALIARVLEAVPAGARERVVARALGVPGLVSARAPAGTTGRTSGW